MATTFDWDGGTVSALRDEPSGTTRGAVVLAHGAGGRKEDALLSAVASGLCGAGFTVVRFDFPYREAGRRLPGSQRHSETCYRAVVEAVGAEYGDPVIGGRSYGGRIASHIAAEGAPCAGLVLLAYPLHAPGRTEKPRDAHLPSIEAPVLFCQGTRDAFANLDLLQNTVERLPGADLHLVEGADHGMKVKGRAQEDVAGELIEVVARFCGSALG